MPSTCARLANPRKHRNPTIKSNQNFDPESDYLSRSGFSTLQGDTIPAADTPFAIFASLESLDGAILDKKFRLLSLLGKGGMGEVFLARHLMLDKDVALKVFGAGNASQEGILRFQREAQSIAKLDHKNIVKVFDFGISEGGIPYYTMEHLIGTSLAERISADGPLEQTQALEFFIQVCDGLAAAHAKGIVHRDLKPGNLFMESIESQKGSESLAKIVDFGIASLIDHNLSNQRLTKTDAVFGSPLYLSPEQALGQTVTASSDIYSLGCTFFEALTGRTPFRGETARETIMSHLVDDPPSLSDSSVNEFSEALEKIVADMLAKCPDDRPKSVDAVKRELTAILAQLKQSESTSGFKSNDSKSQKNDLDEHATVTARDTINKQALILRTLLVLSFLCFAASVCYATLDRMNRDEINLKTVTTKLTKSPSKALPRAEHRYEGKVAKRTFTNKSKVMNYNGLFTSKVVNQNGQSCVIFDFPKGLEMGRFAKSVSSDPSGEKTFPVNSGVSYPIPKVASMAFYPSDVFMKDESGFECIPAEFLLLLKECRIEKKNAAHTIELIARQRELQFLDIAKSKVNDTDIAGLNKLTKLTSLRVDDTGVTGAGVAQFAGLQRLKFLSLSGCNNISAALQKLRNNQCILSMSLDDAEISEDDAKAIGTISNLEILNLRGSRLNDKGLAHLTTLKHLHELDLRGCSVNTPRGVRLLKQLGKQGLQILNLNYEGWSMSDKIQIESYIPGVLFKTERTHRSNVPLDSQDFQMLLEKSD